MLVSPGTDRTWQAVRTSLTSPWVNESNYQWMSGPYTLMAIQILTSVRDSGFIGATIQQLSMSAEGI